VITIRPASITDVPLLFGMLQASAQDQGFPESLSVTPEDLRQDGFGEQPRFYSLVAEVDGVAAGMALYYFDYSTWVSRNGIYLEDLYVDPQFRRHGVARALMRSLAQAARERGCRRLHWLVHRENRSAIDFYRSAGAQTLDEWQMMKLDPETVR